MPALLTIALIWLLLCCVFVPAAVALARASARADEDEDVGRDLVLEWLSEFESPTGQPFFAAPGAVKRLKEELRDLVPD